MTGAHPPGAPAPIAIPDAVRAQIYAHARAAFPAECCGYLTGPAAAGDRREPPPGAVDPTGLRPAPRAKPAGSPPHDSLTLVDAAVACRNAQPDGVHPTAPDRGADTGFVIAGAELLAFARSFDGPRPARVVYHSHPNGRAYFSAVDQELARGPAYPVQHLVVGVTADRVIEAAQLAGGPAYPVQHLVVGVTADRVIEAAQLAWSDDAGAYVEIARWPVEERGLG